MELHFRTLSRDLHYAFLRFPQEAGTLQTGALPAPVALLLSGGSTLAMRCMRGALRVGLRRSRFPLGNVFRFGFCCRVLLVSGLAHGSGGVRFVMTL